MTCGLYRHTRFLASLLLLFEMTMARGPGLTFWPRPDANYKWDTLLRLVRESPSSIEPYVNALQRNLEIEYENPLKTGVENLYDCSNVGKAGRGDFPRDAVCRFDINTLGPCEVGAKFGYEDDEPCILLRTGKLYDWTPKDNSEIKVECHGKYPPDKDNIGDRIRYYPSDSISPVYFPFLNQPNYMPPIVAVKFMDVAYGVVVFVECTARDAGGEIGRTEFELLMD